jgi:uncharacterized RDD family membrane protein YckC
MPETQRNPKEPPSTFGGLEPSRWPGERLGLPAEGRGSIGRIGRRIGALAIDWAIALLVAMFFVPYESPLHAWVTLGVFVVMQIVFIPTIGGSVGHRLVGLNVVPLMGGWIGLRRPIVRTLLLAIVVPALVWDSDQRGLHDRIAGTLVIRS